MAQHQLLQPSFDLYELRASVLIAAIASYAALTLAGRVGSRTGRQHIAWVGWGGAALGLGIAAMHFVGMLSMHLPVEVSYESGRTLLSVLFAVAACTLALDIAGDSTLGLPRLALGSLFFGGAVAGMHFIGISAIRAPVVIDQQPARIAVSVLIAMSTGAGALWLAFRLRDGSGATAGAQRIAGAVILGMAIAGMHYTAMTALQFHASPDPRPLSTSFDGPLFNARGASVLIASASFLVLVGAVVSAFIDQTARQEFRETQITLEHRVAEREAEAQMATELYRLLAEHATDMVSTHRPDGRFDYAAPSWAEFLGVASTEIVGHLPTEFAHPADIPLLLANHKQGLQSSDLLTTLWRCRRGNGTHAWLETSTRPVRDEATGHVQTFVCETRDVTQRKQMEEQLAQSEARFRAAADGSLDAFFVLEAVRDVEGHIVDFVYSELNARGEMLIDRSRRDVLGQRMSEVFPKTAKADIEKLAGVVESGVPRQEETEYRVDARQARWLSYQIVPLGAGVAWTSRDVTDRKHQEEELRALTLVDDLTGLYNRRGFRMLAEQHLRLVKRGGPVSLLACFDLNDFKRVNDLYGHAEGDAALRRTASMLRTAFRDSDIIARFGGDEFVVLALDCGEFCEQLLGRVEAAVDAHNEAAARPYSLSLSSGTAHLDPFAPVSLDALMAEADASLYEAKRRRLTGELMA
jgi:diguanylate cyclase (GGDEF)-like protein/PAS domain S-box-containing protein